MRRTVLALSCALASLAAIAATPHGTDGKMPRSYVDQANAAWAASDDNHDHAPVLLEAYKPLYPAGRLLAGKVGQCVVEFEIGTDGRAANARVEGSDDALCDHAVIALQHWQYQPAMKNGQPVSVHARVPFAYEMR